MSGDEEDGDLNPPRRIVIEDVTVGLRRQPPLVCAGSRRLRCCARAWWQGSQVGACSSGSSSCEQQRELACNAALGRRSPWTGGLPARVWPTPRHALHVPAGGCACRSLRASRSSGAWLARRTARRRRLATTTSAAATRTVRAGRCGKVDQLAVCGLQQGGSSSSCAPPAVLSCAIRHLLAARSHPPPCLLFASRLQRRRRRRRRRRAARRRRGARVSKGAATGETDRRGLVGLAAPPW